MRRRRSRRARESDGEDELSLEVAVLEHSVRIDDALEGEGLLHVDSKLVLVDELGKTAQADRVGIDHDAAEAHAGCRATGGELRIVIFHRCQQMTAWAEHRDR